MNHFDRSQGLFSVRANLGLLLASAALTAMAQTPITINKPVDVRPAAPANTLNLSNLPVLAQPSGMRPVTQSAAAFAKQQRALADSEALANAAKLTMMETASVPPNCNRRILAYGAVGSASSFTVRPGQNVVLQGCFGKGPAGEMRLNGLGAGGYTVLQLVNWKSNFVHARVPEIVGQLNKPVRLQLKFSDGDFSNELNGQFIADRARYEITGHAIRNQVEVKHVGALPPHTDWYSWSGNVDSNESSSGAPPSLHPTGVMLRAPGVGKLGSYFLKPTSPQVALHGYYANVIFGQSQFSNWGPNGELTLDYSTGQNARSYVIFTKLVVEAPVGTVQGTKLPD